MMHRTVGNGHVLFTGDLSAPVKHKLGCPPPKRGLIKHHARHVTAGIFGGLFGGSKGSTKVGFQGQKIKIRSDLSCADPSAAPTAVQALMFWFINVVYCYSNHMCSDFTSAAM